MQDLDGEAVRAAVGAIGHGNDFYFDDSLSGRELPLWPLKSI
jgi:hypothetical protein